MVAGPARREGHDVTREGTVDRREGKLANRIS